MSLEKHELEYQSYGQWFVWEGHVGAANYKGTLFAALQREDVFCFKMYYKESMYSMFQDKLQNCSHDQCEYNIYTMAKVK